MDEQRLRATYDDYKRFNESIVWRDIVSEVDSWLQDIRDKLEAENDIGEIKRFQGIAEACRNFIRLPQSIIDALEVERNG